MTQSHQQLLCDPCPTISTVLLCVLPSAAWHVNNTTPRGESTGGSITAAAISLRGGRDKLLLLNSLEVREDEENLPPDPK